MQSSLLGQTVINTALLFTREGNAITTGTVGVVCGTLKGGQMLQVQFGEHIVQTTPDRILPVTVPETSETLSSDLISLVAHLSAEVQGLRAKLAAYESAAPLAPPRADFSWRKRKNGGDRSRKNGNGHHNP